MFFVFWCFGWMLANYIKDKPVFDRAEAMVIFGILGQVLVMVLG